MLNNKKIYLSAPHMNGTELDYVTEAFNTNWIAPIGPNVDCFEREVAAYVGVEHSVALSSGTAGIHLALKYMGVGQGDIVFCSSLTFSGSCNPILYEKATPVFIDSEPRSWNMSPKALEKAFVWAKQNGKMPKALIVVNLYGQSADWDSILPLCEKFRVPVIEDSAESLGARYKGRQTGSFGQFGIFSFNGNKIITTSGGGMVVSNDRDAVEKMRFWATQSREPEIHYEHREIGYNYRMSNICASIGLGQMKTLDQRIAAKKAIYYRYKDAFSGLPVELMPVYEAPNHWLTVLTIDKGCKVRPRHVIESLGKMDIESRPVWKPMHLQPVFRDYPYFVDIEGESLSDELFARGVCLPSGSAMTEKDLDRVIEGVRGCFGV